MDFLGEIEAGKLNITEIIPLELTFKRYKCSNVEILNADEESVNLRISEVNCDDEIDQMTFISTFRSCEPQNGSIELVITAEELRDLPHNNLLQSLNLPTSNSKMEDIGKQVGTSDVKTPDYIYSHEKKAFILEVKTHRETYLEDVSAHWLGEQWKYWKDLNNKLTDDWGFSYSTIIFFPNVCFCPSFLVNKNWEAISQTVYSAWALQNYIYSRTNVKRFLENDVNLVNEIIKRFKEIPEKNTDDVLGVNMRFFKDLNSPETHKRSVANFQRIIKTECKKIINLDKENCRSMKKKREDLKTSGNQTSIFENVYRNTVSEIGDKHGYNLNFDKSVVQYPLVSLKDTNWNLVEDEIPCSEESIAETTLWSNFFRKKEEVLSTELDSNELLDDFEHKYKDRSSRFIHTIHCSKQAKLELAKRGVRGKIFQNNEEKIETEEMSKKGFPLNAPVFDIEETVNTLMAPGSIWLEPSEVQEPLREKLSQDYNKVQEELSPQTPAGNLINFCDDLNETNLFRALRLIEQVVSEVNFSRQTNLKDPNSYIVKKIPGHDCLIMIVPTRADRHIFFSLCFPKASVKGLLGKPFKECVSFGDYYCTEFVSLDQDRITHLLGCSNKLSAVFCQKIQTNTELDVNNLMISRNWAQECTLSLLVFLEDKAQTSSALLNIRYAYMDLLSPKELDTHPLKILNKMPTIVRSRLLVWILNKVILRFNDMYQDKLLGLCGLEGNDEHKVAGDKLRGFVSWITGEPVNKVSHMLDLSYLGHLHNKEEGDITHGNLQIFSKIIKEELLLRECDSGFLAGDKEPLHGETLKSHEFSKSAVVVMAKNLRNILNFKIKERFPEVLEQDNDPISWIIARRISKLKFSDLATTKASAWNIEADEVFDPKEKGEDRENRRKVMSAMHSLVSANILRSTNVLEASIDAMDHINSRRNEGVLVNLFKKQQLGGAREIFVLTFLDRLMIYILETICRCLCELLDNEMLTKGDAKITRSDNHIKSLKELTELEGFQITAVTSGDATTWCQRFTMRIFGTFLGILLPEPFHPFLTNVLNAVMNKQLQLPTNLLQLWLKYPSMEGFDEGMNELKRQFLGISPNTDLLTPGCRMMRNKSNFMQGILHYTSSLLHSAYLNLLSQLMERDIHQQGYKCVITTKCSSDDSSVLISVVHSEREVLEKRGIVFLRRAMLLINDFYWCFGAKSSLEKTTLSVLGLVEEFNSVWLIKNTVVVPLIKFTCSAFRTPPFCKMDSALRQYASARGQLVASGASFMLVNLVQKHQMFYYYKSLGLFSTSLGFTIYEFLNRCKSPFLGYFVLEPAMLCGLLGFDFAYYTLLRSDQDAVKTHNRLYSSKLSDINENLEFEGQITVGPGGLMRVRKFWKEMDLERDEVFKFYEENPKLLFTDTKTKIEFLKSVELKALEYQTSEIFAGVKDSTTFNRGVYMCTSKVFIERTWHLPQKSEKHTWLYLLKEFADNGELPYDNTTWRNGFVLSDFYEEVMTMLVQESAKVLTPSYRKRRMMVSRSLRSYEGPQILPLMQCAAYKWYNVCPDRINIIEEIDYSWEFYKKEISWLEDSFTTTLSKSPHETAVGLANFLKSFDKRSKTLIALAPMKMNSSTENFIKKLLRWNQWPLNKLRDAPDTKLKTEERKRKFNIRHEDITALQFLSTVSNICALPEINVTDKTTGIESSLPDILLRALSTDPRVDTLISRSKYLDREIVECLKCLTFYNKIMSCGTPGSRRDAMANCLNETGSVYLHYNQRQARSDCDWTGPFNFDLIVNGEKFNVAGYNHTLTSLQARSIQSFLRVSQTVAKTIVDQGIRDCDSNPKQEGIYVDLLTGKQTRMKTSTTIPLLINLHLDKLITLPKDPNLKFLTRLHSLKLLETTSNTTIALGRLHKFLHIKNPCEELLDELFRRVVLPDSITSLLKFFMLDKVLTAGQAQLILKTMPNARGNNASVLIDWLKQNISARLSRKGFMQEMKDIVLEEAHGSDEREDCGDELYNYQDILPENQLVGTDDDILDCLKQFAEHETETQEPGFSNLEVEDPEVFTTDYSADDIDVVIPKGYIVNQEPEVLSEKSWLDNAYLCFHGLSKGELIKLQKGQLAADDVSEDIKLICRFMDWKLSSNDLTLNFDMTF